LANHVGCDRPSVHERVVLAALAFDLAALGPYTLLASGQARLGTSSAATLDHGVPSGSRVPLDVCLHDAAADQQNVAFACCRAQMVVSLPQFPCAPTALMLPASMAAPRPQAEQSTATPKPRAERTRTKRGGSDKR